MPADSDRTPPSLPHTWRPVGVRVAVIGLGLMLLVVCVAAWLGFDQSVRDRFTFLQRLTLLILGAGFAACGWALARARITAEMEALVVVNGFRTRQLAWEEVLAIHLAEGRPRSSLGDGAAGIRRQEGARWRTPAARADRPRGPARALTPLLARRRGFAYRRHGIGASTGVGQR